MSFQVSNRSTGLITKCHRAGTNARGSMVGKSIRHYSQQNNGGSISRILSETCFMCFHMTLIGSSMLTGVVVGGIKGANREVKYADKTSSLAKKVFQAAKGGIVGGTATGIWYGLNALTLFIFPIMDFANRNKT
jgi:hypothetical protein